MTIHYNGAANPDNVTFNGTQLDVVKFNNVVVWERYPGADYVDDDTGEFTNNIIGISDNTTVELSNIKFVSKWQSIQIDDAYYDRYAYYCNYFIQIRSIQRSLVGRIYPFEFKSFFADTITEWYNMPDNTLVYRVQRYDNYPTASFGIYEVVYTPSGYPVIGDRVETAVFQIYGFTDDTSHYIKSNGINLSIFSGESTHRDGFIENDVMDSLTIQGACYLVLIKPMEL